MNRLSENDIYRSVINDVIAQVREAFLDENIDIEVLNHLKSEWEKRLNESGCVDMDPKSGGPTTMRSVTGPQNVIHRPQPAPVPQQIQIQPSTQQLLARQQHITAAQQMEQQQQLAQLARAQQQAGQQQQVQLQQLHQIQQHQYQPVHALPLQPSQLQMASGMGYMQGGARVMPVHQYNAGLVQPHPLAMQQNIVVLSAGQHIPVTLNGLQGQRMILQQQVQQQQDGGGHVQQLDGNGGVEEGEDDVPCSSASLTLPARREKKKQPKRSQPTRKEAERVARSLGLLQLDGGRGGGMSDSSSDDEEEEDDDPLRRIADRIVEGDTAENEDGNEDEEPLNSGDDQSDDEDLATLFDADDVVMCQFEKISRARSKWKFSLKDGIMHIGGKDYCFQKCTGEAEW